jgi:hypothetical protein
VAEHLSSKREAPSSNPSTAKKRKKEKEPKLNYFLEKPQLPGGWIQTPSHSLTTASNLAQSPLQCLGHTSGSLLTGECPHFLALSPWLLCIVLVYLGSLTQVEEKLYIVLFV